MKFSFALARCIIVMLCAVILALPETSSADSVKGVVVLECRSRVVISTRLGFAILDVYGYGPSKGHVVVGESETYGVKDFYNLTTDRSFRAYVEEFWLSAERTIEKLKGKC